MLKHTIFLFLLSFLSFCQAMGSPIDESEAYLLASSFQQRRNPSKLRSTLALQLVYKGNATTLRFTSATPPFYIFNIGANQGFVVVSGEDATKTILGYADEGYFQAENMPENILDWLNVYQQEIESLRNGTLSATSTTTASSQVAEIAASSTTVSPLLGNIKWNQSDPYNQLCPLDAATNKRTLAGCVAVAMAQIMKYYNWPLKGTGTESYIDKSYGTQSVDFSKTSYDWNNMLGYYNSTASPEQTSAAATLVYHCGVAVNMSYSLTASSSSIIKAAEAFVNHFGYDSDIQRFERQYFQESDWETLIKKELDNARPVYYSASSDEGGHAFICDGYDSNDLFHINWGWGGTSNGYFELSALSSEYPGVTGATGGFCYQQSILVGIQKSDATTKPTYQMVINKTGLTPSVTSLSNVSTKTFDLNFGFINNSLNSFTGKFGIGYFKNDAWTMLRSTSSNITLQSYFGFDPYSFTKIYAPTTAGTYTLYALYKPSDSTSWNIIRGTSELNNSVLLTVNNSSATLQIPTNEPQLHINQPLILNSRFYQKNAIDIDASISNTGAEFYSVVAWSLVSVSNPEDRTYLCQNSICCAVGETKTYHFTGNVTVAPGSYYLQASYDSTNSGSTINYKAFDPSFVNLQQVQVYPQPGVPALLLTKSISLLHGNTFTSKDTMKVVASITNNGGFFNSRINGFAFPKSGGRALSSLTAQEVSIDSLETKEITLSGLLDLENGEYSLVLYQAQNSSWLGLYPSNLGTLAFTINNTTNLEQSKRNHFLIHQDGTFLTIESVKQIKKIQLYDLYGRFICQKGDDKTIPVSDLPPGIYLLRIQVDDQFYMERFLKQGL